MTLSEILNKLCIKAGIAEDDPALKSLLASPELTKIEIKNNLQEALEGNLFTEDAAMASPKIKDKLRPLLQVEILNGMDKEIENLIGVAGFDPEAAGEIKKGESTYKRIRTLSVKLDELLKKKSTAKDPDKEGLTEKINAL